MKIRKFNKKIGEKNKLSFAEIVVHYMNSLYPFQSIFTVIFRHMCTSIQFEIENCRNANKKRHYEANVDIDMSSIHFTPIRKAKIVSDFNCTQHTETYSIHGTKLKLTVIDLFAKFLQTPKQKQRE